MEPEIKYYKGAVIRWQGKAEEFDLTYEGMPIYTRAENTKEAISKFEEFVSYHKIDVKVLMLMNLSQKKIFT